MGADRFAQRRRAGTWQRVRRYAWGALAVVVIVFLGWLVGWSNALAVSSVDVSGQTTMKASFIRTTAQVPLGVPLARTDTDAIARRVGALNRIESVDVGRGWPHTITIEVVERTALGWVLSGGENKALDRHGMLFRSYRKPPKALIEVRIGTDDIKLRERSLEEVGSVLQSIKSADAKLFAKIRRVDAESIDSVTLDLAKGRSIRWGSAGETEAKLAVLDALLKIKARTYDVSAPEQPTTKR